MGQDVPECDCCTRDALIRNVQYTNVRRLVWCGERFIPQDESSWHSFKMFSVGQSLSHRLTGDDCVVLSTYNSSERSKNIWTLLEELCWHKFIDSYSYSRNCGHDWIDIWATGRMTQFCLWGNKRNLRRNKIRKAPSYDKSSNRASFFRQHTSWYKIRSRRRMLDLWLYVPRMNRRCWPKIAPPEAIVAGSERKRSEFFQIWLRSVVRDVDPLQQLFGIGRTVCGETVGEHFPFHRWPRLAGGCLYLADTTGRFT